MSRHSEKHKPQMEMLSSFAQSVSLPLSLPSPSYSHSPFLSLLSSPSLSSSEIKYVKFTKEISVLATIPGIYELSITLSFYF